MQDRKKKSMVELTRCSVADYRVSPKLPLILLADNVRSMHNIGALFRTADAFRLNRIILAGISGCPPHPEIAKSALGAEESVRWQHVDDALSAALRLQREGWKICVLEQAHDSIPLHSFSPEVTDAEGELKLVLVAGNEVKGVDQRIVDMADYVLEIPQEGTKHSLNVSTSASIALYHLYLIVNARQANLKQCRTPR